MKAFLFLAALLALLCCCQAGCEHLGPKVIVADRVPYNDAVARSWQEQTLLNIVKLRYVDTPFFIDVAQIVSGYTRGDQVSPTLSIAPAIFRNAPLADRLAASLSYQGVFTDRPTISYAPQTGAQFIRNLTTPILPGRVLFLLQSGYPADVVLNLAVESINGINNRSVTGGQLRPADPAFGRLVRAVRRAQLSGHVGIRVTQDQDNRESAALFFRDQNIDPDLARELDAVRQDLGVSPDQMEFQVVFGAAAIKPNEVAILTRSILRILSELSTFVEVPPEHLLDGIAPDIGEDFYDGEPPIRVFSCVEKPPHYFAAVCYEGHWYWIDKRDTASKRTMAYLLVLLALADTGPREGLPVVTIPAN